MAPPPRGAGVVAGPVPKHAQLRAILVRAITTDLAPDAPIPSERELVEAYRVSRMTVREAIGQLVNEGLLYRVHGKGTFVAPAAVQSQLHLASFSDDMRRRGHEPSSRVLAADLRTPPPAVARALELPAGVRAVHVERLRLADGVPMAHEVTHYPEHLVPGLLEHDLSGSTYDLLAAEYGLAPTTGEQALTAESAARPVAALLGTVAGAPLLLFDRTTRAGDVVVEHTTSRYRADRYSVRMSLDRTADRVPAPPTPRSPT